MAGRGQKEGEKTKRFCVRIWDLKGWRGKSLIRYCVFAKGKTDGCKKIEVGGTNLPGGGPDRKRTKGT